ncbi:sugar phosphate isomerase/epimerase [Spiractinospora alimapuensis]|uniref:sugar phosphate isomerase/epimerase family protein n=1 Tax=Spiractinospora alimapuensis TaxID=2820884 RepID=UPI001F3D3E05|nr:sugar phosphate isomerase/epimerase family protein [Spiractinospora alimapuensis]QVQ52414.1 sugar phosphate isomerase/epimerase [Spiractinospora alimapuensis]
MSGVARTGLRLGYGTNGFTNHRLDEAVRVLADLGYDGVALTPDTCHLDPYAPALSRRVGAFARLVDQLGLDVTVETGARYVLDPRHKHSPTLLDEDPEPRLDYLSRCASIAADLGAPTLSIWSGTAAPGIPTDVLWRRLTTNCRRLLDQVRPTGLWVGFEPEPGMFVERVSDYLTLRDRLGRPPGFGITLDIGHCLCVETRTPHDCVHAVGGDLVAVQIEDMRRGVHEHLEPGHGELDFPPVLSALHDLGYRGLVGVELPRHVHAAPAVAERAQRFLRTKEAHARD